MVSRCPPFWKFDTVDPTLPWFTQSCMKKQKWKFAKVGTTVHDNIFEVLIMGLLSYLYSRLPSVLFYRHHGTTSHIGSCWHVFLGGSWLGVRVTIHLVTIRFVLRYTACDTLHDTIFAIHVSDISFIQELSIGVDLRDSIYMARLVTVWSVICFFF